MPEVVGEMELGPESGVSLVTQVPELAPACLELLANPELALKQSRCARAEVERKFSFEATYGHLADNLLHFAKQRAAKP